jgi:hypothetical protein
MSNKNILTDVKTLRNRAREHIKKGGCYFRLFGRPDGGS